MLFHSTIYRTDVQLATPSTFTVSFIVPEFKLSNAKYQIYTIDKNTVFQDINGFDFYIPEKIVISLSQSNVDAYCYTDIDRKELQITRAPDPVNPGNYIYLINYDNVQQLKRVIKKFIVPSYEIGSSFIFSQNIDDYTGLVSARAWWNTTGVPANTAELERQQGNVISSLFGFEEFNVKYYKYGSTRYDLDLFMQIYERNITLETGNGLIGRYLNANTEIILEVITCMGDEGNLKNTSFTLGEVTTEIIDNDDTSRLFNTSINGVSAIGGIGGKKVASVDELRQAIFDKISFRNSLTSINDFENFFKFNNFKPFVDAKFLDARSFLFIFNALFDRKTNDVIQTAAINISEATLAMNPFYPTYNYNGIELISPFYYKFLSTNETEAYMVNPSIPIKLTADLDSTVLTQAATSSIKNSLNQLGIELKYDFERRKSYFKITYGVDPIYSYRITTDQFAFTLDYTNSYTWEVNTLFTDDYCILLEPVTGFKLEIIDRDNNIVSTQKSYEDYYQLISKQILYKYFKVDETASDYALQIDTSDFADGYLNNILRELLIQADEIIDPMTQGETPMVLRVPYLSKAYFDKDYNESYLNLDSFFRTSLATEFISFNTRIAQSFYNTIEIPSKYQENTFKINNNFNKSNPRMEIALKVYIDKEAFEIDNTFSNLDDFIFSMKMDIIDFFKGKLGFQIQYYESELESYLYAKYNLNEAQSIYLKNIDVISPKVIKVNDSDTIFYGMKNNPDLTFDDLIDYNPPFFYYDLDDISLQIVI